MVEAESRSSTSPGPRSPPRTAAHNVAVVRARPREPREDRSRTSLDRELRPRPLLRAPTAAPASAASAPEALVEQGRRRPPGGCSHRRSLPVARRRAGFPRRPLRFSIGPPGEPRAPPASPPCRRRHRLEHQRRRRRPGPVRPALEELGAGEAEEDDRGVGEAARQVLDEVEEGRLGPVHVVEDGDERPVDRKVLEDLADGWCLEEGLVARALHGLVPARPAISQGRT